MRVGRSIAAALLLGAGLMLASSGARGHLSNEQEQEHPDETNQQHQQQPPSSLQPSASNMNTHHLQQAQPQPQQHHDQVHQQQLQQHGQQHSHNQDLQHHNQVDQMQHQQQQNHQQQQQHHEHEVAPHFAPESSTQRFEMGGHSDAYLATPMQHEGQQQQQNQPQNQQDHLTAPIHFDQVPVVMHDQLDKSRPAMQSSNNQQSNNLVQQTNQMQPQQVQQQPAKQEQQLPQLMGTSMQTSAQDQTSRLMTNNQQSPIVQAIRQQQQQQVSKPQQQQVNQQQVGQQQVNQQQMPMQSFQTQQPQAPQTQQPLQQLQAAPVPPYQQQAAAQVQGAQTLQQQQQQAGSLRRAQLQKTQASAPMLSSNQQAQQQQQPQQQQQQQQPVQQQQQQQIPSIQQQQQPMMMSAPQQQQQQYQPMQSQQQANLMQQQQQASMSIVQAQLVPSQLSQMLQNQQQQQQQLVSKYQPSIVSPLYLGHNPFIEILRPLSYADDNIVTLNLSHSHIYEIDSDAFVGQRFEHIDLSNNKLGLIHSRSFRIGPNHSRHTPFDPLARHGSSVMGGGTLGGGVGGNAVNMGNGQGGVGNMTKFGQQQQHYATRRPPPAHPKSVTIDFSHNPAIVALSGAFDHIDVPNCLLNFTNSTVELKFGAFKKYFKEHPGHIIDIDTVDCCDQEWLLGYKHNFVSRTHCAHDPNLYLLKVSQQTIIDSCIAYVTSARHNLIMPSSGIIHTAAANGPRHPSGSHPDNQQYLTYLILGGTAMILTSLSIYIIFYMFSLKAAFVYSMQTQKS